MAGPAPRYGMKVTLVLVSCCRQDAAHGGGGVLVDELRFAGVGPHPGDQLIQPVGRQVLPGDHELRVDGDQPDGREILLQVVVQIIDDAADVGVPLADVDGVTVRHRARDPADRDAAARAADVLDHDRLAKKRPHLLGHNPRSDVSRAARRKRHDQRDLARRIGLRRRRRGARHHGREHDRQKQFGHVVSPNPQACHAGASGHPAHGACMLTRP